MNKETRDNPCIFCQISLHQAPAITVYEDEYCIAFMDIHPLGEGHVLVVPKQHADRLDKLENSIQLHLFSIANRIIEAQRKSGFGTEGTNLLINDGKAANQTVPHVHIHVIPRKRGDLIQSAFRIALHVTGFFGLKSSKNQLNKQADAIRNYLRSEPASKCA